MERAKAASEKALALRPDLPEVQIAQGWVLYAAGQYDDVIRLARLAIERKRDCEGAYYLLGRALFAAGRYQDMANIVDAALEASGEDYNIYIPIVNCLGALGKQDALLYVSQRRTMALENHLQQVPEDARARILLANCYALVDRVDDALREAKLAVTLRPNEATVLYNAACTFCELKMKAEALETLKKAWVNGFKDAVWARRDPDLAVLHGDPEFERLYPEEADGGPS
jgi:tetratricopeptide (TPR) repeat protein